MTSLNGPASTETIAAVDYNLGQIWDSLRALRTAFLIDPNVPPEPHQHMTPEQCPSWDQLSTEDRTVFKLHCAPHVAALNCLQGHWRPVEGGA